MSAEQTTGVSADLDDWLPDRDVDDDPIDDTGEQRGGFHSGYTLVLWEIDPDTLPVENPWPEVRRRIAAKQAGIEGWRTGELQQELDGWEDER